MKCLLFVGLELKGRTSVKDSDAVRLTDDGRKFIFAAQRFALFVCV